MNNNMFNLLKKSVFLFCMTLFITSCSKESNAINDEEAFEKIATQFIENSKGTTINYKKVNSNYESFISSLNAFESKSNEVKTTFTFEELGIMFEANFDIPRENTKKFLNIAYENRDVLLQENARELLIEQLELQIENIISQGDSNEKWLFAALYGMLADENTHCSLQVLAHIADAMILTAATAISAPTGVGAVVTGTGVASSVAAATYAASNCQ